MKRKNEDETTQTSLRLSQDLYRRLRRAGGEGGVGEEIRRRLEDSFETEKAPANPKTRELLDAIAYAANETAGYYGNWSEDAFAFEVFTACVDLLLKGYQPKGEAIPSPSEFAEVFFAPDHSTKDIRRSIVGDFKRAKAKRAEGKR
jgi:hypothetical protein